MKMSISTVLLLVGIVYVLGLTAMLTLNKSASEADYRIKQIMEKEFNTNSRIHSER